MKKRKPRARTNYADHKTPQIKWITKQKTKLKKQISKKYLKIEI